MKLWFAFCDWSATLIAAWWDELQDSLLTRRYRHFCLCLAAAIAVVFFISVMITATLFLLKCYGAILIDKLWLPFTLICAIFYFAKKNKRNTPPPSVEPAPDPLGEAYATANWENVANIMMDVFNICAPNLGLSKPFTMADIDCPSARVVQRGTVFLYQFVIGKANAQAPADCGIIQSVLQQRLTSGLANMRFEGVSEATKLIDGVSYPTFMVDKVVDGHGLVTILIAQPSEAYIKQLRLRKQAQTSVNNQRPPIDDI